MAMVNGVGKKKLASEYFPAVKMAEELKPFSALVLTPSSNTLLCYSLDLWLHPRDFGKISVSFTKFLIIFRSILPFSKILLNTQQISTTNSIKEDFLIPHIETGHCLAFPHGT